MHPTRFDTAILLFSRSAAGDAVVKPLIVNADRKRQQAVATVLIRHAQRIAAASGLPIFVISERQQHGFTFGERFADAFQQIFARGFARVIAIGNDCPTLTAADLRTAAQKMDTVSAVFGPATDGGAYLIGLRQDNFDPADFAALDWQTDHTLAALQTYAADDFCCLSEKSDVDSATDLQRQLRGFILPIYLKIKLLNLSIPTCPNWLAYLFSTDQAVLLSSFSLRGPPR